MVGELRRKMKGVEGIGGPDFFEAIERAAAKKGLTVTAYMHLVLLVALEEEGIVRVQEKGNELEVCFVSDEGEGPPR